MMKSAWRLRANWVAAAILATGNAWAQELTREQKEEFLRSAEVIRTKRASKGITGVVRATLRSQDGAVTHDAAIQCIDESKAQFQTDRGTELNFRDSYKFNLAAYRLSILLGEDMVPPHVERRYSGSECSFAWWVDDVLMDEQDRLKKKVKPPDQNEFNAQYAMCQVFDQLIYNVDRNQQNFLITKDWKLWMIDHSRAFRLHHTLENPKALKMCERGFFGRLKGLDRPTLEREMGRYLKPMEIEGLLKRRDRLVTFFEKQGPAALYTYKARELR
jgi:hypothetical protein